MSSSTSSDLAAGEKFLQKLFYVQHVDKEKDTVIETPGLYLEEYLLANRNIFADFNFTEYLASPNENLSRSQHFKIVVERFYRRCQSLLESSWHPSPANKRCPDSRLCSFQNGELYVEWSFKKDVVVSGKERTTYRLAAIAK